MAQTLRVDEGLMDRRGRPADPMSMPWKAVRFFRLSERRQAELAARRMRDAEGQPVRIVGCAGRGLKLVKGEDERREQRPVDRDRRRG